MGTITKQSRGEAFGSIEIVTSPTTSGQIIIALVNGIGNGSLLIAGSTEDTPETLALKIKTAWDAFSNVAFSGYTIEVAGATVSIIGGTTPTPSSYNTTTFNFNVGSTGTVAGVEAPAGGGAPNINIAGDYSLYGSTTNPVTEATLNADAVSLAVVSLTVSSTTPGGAAYGDRNLVLSLVGPNNGDQRIHLRVYRADRANTLPVVPAGTTLIDVGDIEDSDSVAEIQSKILDALGASTAVILVSTLFAPTLQFEPECGGAWTFSFLQNLEGASAASCSIVDGGAFGSSVPRTQSGISINFSNNAAGSFNFSEIIGSSLSANWGNQAISTFNNGDNIRFRNHSGRTNGNVETQGGAGYVVYNAASVQSTSLESKIDSWVAINNASSQTNTVFVKSGTDTLNIFSTDNTLDFNPTGITKNAVDNFGISVNATAVTRTVQVFTALPDPHRDNTETLIKFIDPTTTNFSQVAPFYVKTGELTTWTMDNISLEFGAGFRFENGENAESIYNWDQVDVLKTGDGQGNQALSMFQNKVVSTLNWNNCNIKWYPTGADNTKSAFMFGNVLDEKNIILNWDRVFIRYAANNQMDYNLNFDPVNSRIINSGLIGDGTSTGAPFFNAIVYTPQIRLLEPYSFIVQDRPIIFNASSNEVKTESYTTSNFFAGTTVTGSGIDSSTIFNPFQNGTDFFKFLDFRVAGDIYENDAAFTNASFNSATTSNGSLEYGVTFDPQYFNADGSDLSTIRNEFRYGSSSDVNELRVKEMFERGPIGGSSGTISNVIVNSTNLLVNDVFTIPRPNGLDSVTLTAVSGTPIQNGTARQFNIGASINTTIVNMANAFTGSDLGMWFINPLNSSLTVKRFLIGNNIGGTAGIVTYSGASTNVTISLFETGAPGSGVNTHPFNNSVQYVDNTNGLINTNTLTDNRYSANTSTSVGVGNNNGLFLTYNKTNYQNNTGGGSTLQTDIKPYGSQYTVYTKRTGFRPEIETYNFSDGPQVFSKILVTDANWENVTKEVADAYTVADMTNTNNVYRWIENETDDRSLPNQAALSSVYDRFINLSSPITNSGLIDFNTLNYRLTRTGTNLSYTSTSPQRINIPVTSSLAQGNTVRGFTTTNNAELSGTLDLNNVIVDALNVNIDSSTTTSITNGVISAINANITDATVNGTTFQPRIGETAYSVIQSGTTEFDNVTMVSGGLLRTFEDDLHGLIANNITIRYEGTSNFSIDSTNDTTTDITNSNIHFDNLTSAITWFIDTDLSTCTAFNNTSQIITIVLGPNGIVPTLSDSTNFRISRTLIFTGLTASNTVRYRIERNSDNALIAESFTDVAGNTDVLFTEAGTVDVYAVRTDSVLFKPRLILDNIDGTINISFDSDVNLNLAVVDDSTITGLLDDYVDNVDNTTLEVEEVGRKTFTIAVINTANIVASSDITINPDTVSPPIPVNSVKASSTLNTGDFYLIVPNDNEQTAANIGAAIVRENTVNATNLVVEVTENIVTVTALAPNENLLNSITTTAGTGLDISIINTIELGDIRILLPAEFESNGTNEPTSSSYWDTRGGRGAGQYVFKLLERFSAYGFSVMRNKAKLAAATPSGSNTISQLIEVAPSDRLAIITESLQLHSKIGATVVAFFPGQFVDSRLDSETVTFSIVGSGNNVTTPGGFVAVYQAAIVVSPDSLALRIFAELTGEELNDRRVTRENMNRLGILAPINDNQPT